jgi:superfamily I DNA/RNA helicase
MFEGKEVKVLLANAGAGKTSKLMDILFEELKTRRPEEIAFVTFTKKGAGEGLKRACNKFKISPDELPYFRTLHSLTFRALNLNLKNIFGKIDERKFNKETGYYLNRCDVGAHPSKDSKYLDFYDLERSNAVKSKQLAEADIEVGYYHRLVQKYEEYKNRQHLVDFFDCLIKYVREGESLPCKVVMIDECQDITALQWQVINKAFANAEKVYVAGDENQSIYTYAGARPDYLIKLANKYPRIELNASYRLPKNVYDVAKGIVGMIQEKTDKSFDFREGNIDGSVTSLNSLERLKNFMHMDELKDDKVCQWYLLARNNCFLDEYIRFLEDNLIPYWNSDGFFMGGEIMSRIKDYNGFALEGYKTPDKREKFRKKFGVIDFSVPFYETNLFTEGRKWVYASYIEKYGLDKLQEMCKWNPQVIVSTIHFVKGGEAKNVAIMLDSTARSYGEIYDNLDSELRVLYVGVTRARENLFVIDSQSKFGYDKLFDVVKDEYNLEW